MNWKQILADLQDQDITQPQIAERCGCSQACISDLATGKTAHPRYPVGAALLAEHEKAMKRAARKAKAQA